MDNEMDIEGVR